MQQARFIFSVLFLSLWVCGYAQSSSIAESIEGNILTTKGYPAEFVQVILLNTNYGSVSDNAGTFRFKAPAGTYTMAVFSQSVLPEIFPVTIKKDTTNLFPDIIVHEEKKYLDAVVVTGTRTPRALKDSPVLTKVISGTDIAESGAVTALEALENFVPGVLFTPNAMGDNINIAGLDNKYILVLVDGERLVNERTENVNFSRLNAFDIKQIEIIDGASSVLYGSNAIGSVINIITRDTERPFEGEGRVRYSEYNTWVGNVMLGFKTGKLSSRTTFSSQSSDGYDANRNKVSSGFSMNPYCDYSVGEKLKYAFSEKWDIELKGSLYRNETWFIHKYQTRQDKNYSWGGKLNYTVCPTHKLTLSGNTDNYKGYIVYKLLDDPKDYANGSANTTFRLLDVWDATGKIQVVSGVEVNLEETYSADQFGEIPGDRDANNWNLFTQGEFKTETGLEALLGARYTRHSDFGGYLSPKISLMYKLSDFRFRANLSNGFKAPTLKEMCMVFPHKIGDDVPFWIIGNPGLVPEEAWYKAISAEYIGRTLNASVTVHDNLIQDKIVTEQNWNSSMNRTELKYENVEDTRITGVDVSVQWDFLNNFSLRGGYSFADASDRTTGWQLPGYSKHNVSCNLTFRQKHLPFLSRRTKTPYSLILLGRFMSSRVLNREVLYDTDGITVLGKEEEKSGNYFVANLVYNQRFPIYKRIRGNLQFGINNLFDYVNHDSAATNTGRTCFVNLGASF